MLRIVATNFRQTFPFSESPTPFLLLFPQDGKSKLWTFIRLVGTLLAYVKKCITTESAVLTEYFCQALHSLGIQIQDLSGEARQRVSQNDFKILTFPSRSWGGRRLLVPRTWSPARSRVYRELLN